MAKVVVPTSIIHVGDDSPAVQRMWLRKGIQITKEETIAAINKFEEIKAKGMCLVAHVVVPEQLSTLVVLYSPEVIMRFTQPGRSWEYYVMEIEDVIKQCPGAKDRLQ